MPWLHFGLVIISITLSYFVAFHKQRPLIVPAALTGVQQAWTSRTALFQAGARPPAASHLCPALWLFHDCWHCFLLHLLPAERPGVQAQPAVQTPAWNETDPQLHPGSSSRSWQSCSTHDSYSHLHSAAEPVAPLLHNPGPLLPRPPDPVSHRALGTLGKPITLLQPSLAFLISIICCAIVSSKLQHVLGIQGDMKVVLVLETDTFAHDN